jgi:hypothetical protein
LETVRKSFALHGRVEEVSGSGGQGQYIDNVEVCFTELPPLRGRLGFGGTTAFQNFFWLNLTMKPASDCMTLSSIQSRFPDASHSSVQRDGVVAQVPSMLFLRRYSPTHRFDARFSAKDNGCLQEVRISAIRQYNVH